MRTQTKIEPTHVAGINKGEETVLKDGREPGRGGFRHYRSARDSTGINADNKEPILPGMPKLPPQ